jgi:alkanesulfonate monooxygenase SsuD/methylene tetrahydromethanopterin reductase-like flavin-dependent oxidoreductase (luciferase family)
MAVIFQGSDDPAEDRDVYEAEVRLADLAEPLGFESIWTVEHHFTDYAMCPDVLQFLTFMAGRTRDVQLGSAVVVLPWHDPVRVAEQVTMLDLLSGGRVLFGMGRGLGRVEFEGFRLQMDEARDRFIESAQMILRALEHGTLEGDGTLLRQPARPLRPGPARSFRGRVYAAAQSPESMGIMAELGVGGDGDGAGRVPPHLPRGERHRGAAARGDAVDLRGPRR